MASLEVDGEDLVVVLHAAERAGALHGSPRAPLAAVRSVRAVDDAWAELRGLRVGTGIPELIALGTFLGAFGKDFVAVYRHRPGVVVELDGGDYARFLVTEDDAPSAATTIEAAVAAAGGRSGDPPGSG